MASGDTLVVWRPQDNEPPAAPDYALADLRNGHPLLAFADGTPLIAIFSSVMPSNYAGGGITVNTYWAAVPTSGTVGWLVAFETIAAGGQDIDTDGFAADQTITAATVPATSGVTALTSVAVAAGAATDSVAVADLFRLRVTRNTAVDTAAGIAQLLAVTLVET
jgi:hypothetical protein